MQEQFRLAIRSLAAGQPQEAVRVCRALHESHPEDVDVLQLLGVALLESGQLEEGEKLLRLARAERPQDPEIPYNFGSALLKQGRYEEAVGQFDLALALQPSHIHAHTNRGTALLELKRLDDAALAYQTALRLAPDHASAWFNLGNIQAAREDFPLALEAYRRAVALQPGYQQAQFALGQTLLSGGQWRDALEALTRARNLDPQQADVWRLLGQALAADNQFDEAVVAAHKATELAGDSADNWNSYGAALTSLGRLEASEAALRTALELDSGHRLATANLAALMELSNRQEECDRLTADGLARWPEDVTLGLTRGRWLRRQGRSDEALAMLRKLDLDAALPQQQREARFLLGQVHDALGDYSAAFQQFRAANAIAAQQWSLGKPAPDSVLPAARQLAATIDQDFVADWPQGSEPQRSHPAFILSFQRSGTTLLDTMLGAHPGTLVMEELPALNQLIAHIGDYPAALRSASTEQIAQWRRFYFQRVEALTGQRLESGTLLIDKSPLHSLHGALLQRVFPGAPIIFALRHPADVVLSCFMQDFTMSPFMLHYTTLEGVTQVYQLVMKLWQGYRRILPLNVLELRYEELVEAPQTQLRRVLQFLALPWDDAVLDHATHARGRGLINTPSYHQVTQPVYRGAIDRWRRYRPALEPVLDKLAPSCREFGYDLEP